MLDCGDSLLPPTAVQFTYGTLDASHDCQGDPRGVPKTKNLAVYDVQRHLLNGRPMYLDYSKNDFTGILLGAIGPYLLSSDVVDTLFHEIDTGGNGLIDAEQIAHYLYFLDETDPPISNDFLSKSFATFLFFCASSISITNNLFRRTHGEGVLTIAASVVTMWLSLVASGMFVWEILCITLHEEELLMLLWKNLTLRQVCVIHLMQSSDNSVVLSNLVSLHFIHYLLQIINFFWLLGAAAYVIAVHGSELLSFPEHFLPMLWVIGGASYFVGGLLSVLHIYSETLELHKQNEEMMHKIHSFVDSNSPSPSDVETTYAVEEDDDFSGISLKKTNMELVLQDTEYESNTLDTELMTQSTGSIGAGPIIGKDMLSLDGSDSLLPGRRFQIDCQELYNYLEGPINIDVFVHAVQAIIQDRTSTAVHFSEYATETWWISSHIKAVQKLVMLPSFYIAIMYAVAGALFTDGAYDYKMPKSTVQNMFLMASSLYLGGSTYSLYKAWKTTNNEWYLFHSCRLALHHKALMTPTQPCDLPDRSFELD